MDLPPAVTFSILGILAAGVVHRVSKIGQRDPLLPPGPATKPIVGNITLLPKKDIYLKFSEWAEQYGEVFSLKISSKTVIVISSPDAVIQIMEKNGLITAGRPRQAHVHKVLGEDGALSIVQYGPLYRKWRKAANEVMKPSACERHVPIQQGEASQLMVSLLDRPEDFFEEVKRTVLSVAFSIFFGVRSPSMSSPEPQTFIQATEEIFRLSGPGEYPPVNVLPVLGYIPDRFANNWKSRSEKLKVIFDELWLKLYERTKKRMEAGISTGCFVETLLSRGSEENIDPATIRNMAGSYMGAAAHTTIATMQWFIMLAAIYPKEQEKLIEEMDRVVGRDRLPKPEDLPNLPYLRAFIRELFRFRTIAPLGVPHVATEDQMYKGYLIPKGSTIYVNIWGIFHDPTIFDHPNEFNPERFLNPTPEQEQSWKKIETLQFGVGRRICPGMHVANTTVELTVASLIWGFEFHSPAEGGPDVHSFTAFLTCNPSPFRCDIKVRSAGKEDIIRRDFTSHQPFFDMFERDV